MGQRTTLSGHIQESWYVRDEELLQSMSRHNDEVLAALPGLFIEESISNGTNFLTRSMFGITETMGDSPTVWRSPAYRGRVIHFAGAYSSLWDQWPEWLVTFESLLGQLYWENAAVTQVNEYLPPATCIWHAGRIDVGGSTPPSPPGIRSFVGPRSIDEVPESPS